MVEPVQHKKICDDGGPRLMATVLIVCLSFISPACGPAIAGNTLSPAEWVSSANASAPYETPYPGITFKEAALDEERKTIRLSMTKRGSGLLLNSWNLTDGEAYKEGTYRNFCKDKQIRSMLKSGYTMSIVIRPETGKGLGLVTVIETACKNRLY